MKKEKSFNTKTIKKKDLEKLFDIKLSREEFREIKEQGIKDSQVKINGVWRSSIVDSYKDGFYSNYIIPLREQRRKEAELKEYMEIIKDSEADDEVSVDDEKPIKEKPWRWKDIDPFFFIPNNAFGGFLILLFLTWLIFSVIFGGGDLDPGAPRFFTHDGG